MTATSRPLIQRGDWLMQLRPDVGGAIARLKWRDHDILRPAPMNAASPIEMGNFPLVPFANRVANGQLGFAGRNVHLPSHPLAEPHALHGVGWQQGWSVIRSDIDTVDLGLVMEPSEHWPWAWSATQHLQLGPDGLVLKLAITNRDNLAMPAGLGLHPYFAVRSETVLITQTDGVWINGPDDIPRQKMPVASVVDWSRGARMGSLPFVDNCYCGWSGMAELLHDTYTVRVSASPNARWLQIYAPRGENYICIEPMTHRPDAVNAPDTAGQGMVTLEPGQSISTSMLIMAQLRTPNI